MDRTQGSIFFGNCLLLQLRRSKEVGLIVRRSWCFLAPKSGNRKRQTESLISVRTSVARHSAVKSLQAKAAAVKRFTFNPPSVCVRLKADLHGGAGEALHNTLGERAGGRCFHHLLLLWSCQWPQNAHWNLISCWFTTAEKVNFTIFYMWFTFLIWSLRNIVHSNIIWISKLVPVPGRNTEQALDNLEGKNKSIVFN